MQRCMGCMREFSDEYKICPHCGYTVGTDTQSKNYLPPGTILQSRYTLGKVLGQGGFGITYIAWDNNIGRAVAIKEYMPNAFASRITGEKNVSCFNKDAQRQFDLGLEKTRKETHALSKFGALESVVKVYDCIAENNTAYIVMELLRGKTVNDILAERGKLSFAETMHIMTPVLQTLDAMHRAGMIHRDVAPDNIFVCDDGKIKLLDFGAARVVSGTDDKTLSVMLKAGYAPVEQYSSRGKQGAYTDVYAASATIYKMLTGVTPPDSLGRTMSGDNLRTALSQSDAPQSAKETILCGMMLEPKKRIQSAGILLDALTNNTSPRKNRKNIWIVLIAALAVLAVAAAVVAHQIGNHRNDETTTVQESSAAAESDETTQSETTQARTEPETTAEPTTKPALTAADLKAVLQNQTSSPIIDFSGYDYNNDGVVEAFALVGRKETDEDDPEEWTVQNGKILYIHEQSVETVLEISFPYVDSRIFTLDQSSGLFGYGVNQSAGGSGSRTALYTVDSLGNYSEIKGSSVLAGIPATSDHGWLEGVFSSFDINSDGTGHTWKPYFFYYDASTNSLAEYGGSEITEAQLYALSPDVQACISQAKQNEWLSDDVVPDTVYYRKNGIVNINFKSQTDNGMYRNCYVNLYIHNGKAGLYAPADPDMTDDFHGVGDGYYKPFITNLRVVYPDQVPTG